MEHYKTGIDWSIMGVWMLLLGCLFLLVYNTLEITRARADMAEIRAAQKALNDKYHVEYNYSPPPGWMRK